jgi:hypothetical protein
MIAANAKVRAFDEMQMTDQMDLATLSVALNELGRLV